MLYLNLNMPFRKISKFLLDVDIESNPGPNFDKVVTSEIWTNRGYSMRM